MTTTRCWVIGRGNDCDLVISAPAVSSRHCRLTETPQGFVLEDLGSANGTFVNNQRIVRPVLLRSSDRITLGPTLQLPWPPTVASAATPAAPVTVSPSGSRTVVAANVLSIGRTPDNDIVLDFPMVSGHHARIVLGGRQAIIEDLGSTNGTSLGQPGQRITRAPLNPDDVVFLGSLRIPAARLLAGQGMGEAMTTVEVRGSSVTFGRNPDCEQVLDAPMVSGRHARLYRQGQDLILEDLGSTNGTFLNGQRVLAPCLVRPGDVIGLGSYRFTLTDGGNLKKADFRGNATLEARGVAVKAGGRTLIEGASLTIYPSEFVGLMGPSGAGKTTLMNALNGYTPPSGGRVLFNGQDLYEHYDQFRTCLGYVPQDDVMHRDLTVGQALYYSARLRLPSDYSADDIRARIQAVLRQLDLEGTEDVLIGSAEKKGISGGQRRRVNLAMELITDPLVLFLDEPTSGLSSEDALTVMKVLRGLADAGKTILLTIHQPSLEVFRLMDNLVLMGKDSGSREPGQLAFYGPAYPDSIRFFNPDRYPSPQAGPDPSPDELLGGLKKRPTAEWCAAYRQSAYARDFIDKRAGQGGTEQGASAVPTRRVSAWYQWWVLVRRGLTVKCKDRVNSAILMVQAPIVATLIVMVFGKQARSEVTPESWPGVASAVGVSVFLMALAALWFGASNAVREIVGEWAIYHRERMVNLKIPAYLASKLTILGGMCVIQCGMLLGITGSGCDLQGSWVMLFALLLLASFVGTVIGLTLSVLVRTSEAAIALLPIVLLPMVILGGAIEPIHKMHKSTRLLCQVIPTRWAFEGLLQVEAQKRPTFTVPAPLAKDGKEQTQDMAEPYFPENDRPVGRDEWLAVAVLVALMVGGVAAVMGILRLRDVH
jgi:ABC-type multidrug transport system ATPase subunit/pSer/pThr/pTyr-binding forkhead associated (FHA) protein